MCNLNSITRSQEAMRRTFRVMRDLTGNLPSLPAVFPDTMAPIVRTAMRRMGIGKDEMSGHGCRAVARTILDEVLGVRPDYIEHQLAHAVRDPNGRAYNWTAHLPERRKMMQQWADYLDKLKAGAEVIRLDSFS
jgi:hypothetical protein